MAAKLVLAGLFVLGTAAFQVFADEGCLAVVECNQGDGAGTEWMQIRVPNASVTDKMRAEITLLQKRNDKMNSKNARQQSEISFLRMSEAEFNATMSRLQPEIASLKVREADLNDTAQRQQAEITSLKLEHNTTTKRQQAEITSLQSRESELSATVESQQKALQALQTKVSNLENTFTSGQSLQDTKISGLSTVINFVDRKAAGILQKLKALTSIDIGSVSLINGSTSNEGRVQITILGHVGTICDDSWGEEESAVVCRELGKSPPTTWDKDTSTTRLYGKGTGPIWIDDVVCSGSESRLSECSFTFSHNCYHYEDVGVKCGS